MDTKDTNHPITHQPAQDITIPSNRTPADLRLSRRAFLRSAIGLGGIGILGTMTPGCGPSASQPTAVPTAVAQTPQHLIMGNTVEVYTIDPAIGFDAAIASSLRGLYDSLFRHVGNPPTVIPWLAEHYESSPDGLTWTFQLTKKAVFHDGTPVTAAAVKFSADRLLRIGQGPASLFSGILDEKSVQVRDDHTLTIALRQPTASFLHALPWLFILNPKQVEANAGSDDGKTWLAENEAGSGPFRIKQWKPGELYEFEAIPSYWKGWPTEGHLSGYTRKIMKDAGARLQALEKGEVAVVDWMPPPEQQRLQATGKFWIAQGPSLQDYQIKLNNQEGYTADLHVRKALSYAIDRKALQDLWAGLAVPSEGPLPVGVPGIPSNLPVYSFDLAKAKAELAQSEWPEGGFNLDFAYVRGLDEERASGELIRDQLAKLNIKVNLIPMAWDDAVASFKESKTAPAMFPLYSAASIPDPDAYLWSAYHSSQAGVWTNPGHYLNTKLDDILQQARNSIDTAARDQLYAQAQQLILEDAANIFCVSPPDNHIFSATVKGVTYCPLLDATEDVYWWHLEK